MSNVTYHLVEGEKVSNVTAFFPDEHNPVKTADSRHPYWNDIVNGLRSGDDDVYSLFDVKGGLKKKLDRLSDRVDFDGEMVFFDGSPVNDALAKQIARFLEQGVSDWEPLVKFWEKVATNPSEHSRENLYRWLSTHDFSVTVDGDIVGYKGVKVVDSVYKSIHAGPAYVDGVHVNGFVPNQPGTVVSMPRADVTENPAIGCHVGLHVGTWNYAQSFAQGAILEVHVNPRDVVSVPTECGDAKMRVSKYTVAGKVAGEYANAVVIPEEDFLDEDEWEGDVGYNPLDF